MKVQYIKLFIRLALGVAFLSAVADRFGMWPAEVSAWGDFATFQAYTGMLTPWIPDSLLPALAWGVTVLEIILGITLLIGFKTRLSAQISGVLILIFALSMTFISGIKGPLDYSVFSAAAAAFGLSLIKERYLEVDSLIDRHSDPEARRRKNLV